MQLTNSSGSETKQCFLNLKLIGPESEENTRTYAPVPLFDFFRAVVYVSCFFFQKITLVFHAEQIEWLPKLALL
jgi:hypothetical protein